MTAPKTVLVLLGAALAACTADVESMRPRGASTGPGDDSSSLGPDAGAADAAPADLELP